MERRWCDALNGCFFTLIVIIPIAVPLVMLFMLRIHIQRLAYPEVNPPRSVAISVLAVMTVGSLFRPALSQGTENPDTVVTEIGPGWFYLGAYPLLDLYRGNLLWLSALLVTIALLVVPWLIPQRGSGSATVSLVHRFFDHERPFRWRDACRLQR